MKITAKTIDSLNSFLIENQEADITSCIAERLGISSSEALSIYYSSNLASLVESGELGMQYLSPEYLADEAIKEHVISAS